MKIYNSVTLKEEREKLAKNKGNDVLAYRGNAKANLESTQNMAERVIVDTDGELGKLSLEALWHRVAPSVMNAEAAPSVAEIEAFWGKFFLDLQRRTIESQDLTSLIAREQVNANFAESVTLRQLLPYRGAMATIQGENDGVPLIEQHTGTTDTLTMLIKAVGWKDSLKNMLFNNFFSMDKVVQAAVDAYTDMRNAMTAGVIVGATYVASQQQAAITTSGLTLDEKTYETVLAARKKIIGLLDILTGRKIIASSLRILCNSADSWQLSNVINGQLNANGGQARGSNRPALGIDSLVEYDHGINDGVVIGKKTMSFPGVTAGKCYVYVPDAMIVATKRPLTLETGMGSVLELSTEERAWYAVQNVYDKIFLGSSYPGTSVGAGYGYVVEVTLPT